MRYYQQLAQMGAFTLEDAAEVMHNTANASKYLNSMIKSGKVNRIKQNLYTCIDLVAGEDVADKYIIASHINRSSFVAFHSAFEFYGFYNQVFYDMQVGTKKRFINFETDANKYFCYLSDYDDEIVTIKEVRVTSIERTIVDCINMLGKVIDTEELVKCLQLVHVIDIEKVKKVLKAYDKEILYRKTGYFLSFFAEQLDIDETFFDFCRANADFTHRGKISGNEVNNLTYIKKWSLYGYEDLFALVEKGGTEDA